MKSRILFSLLFVLFLLSSCKEESEQKVQLKEVSFSGKTMGTTYQVKYIGEKEDDLQKLVDQLLEEINLSVSTYIPESTISKINSSKEEKHSVDNHFISNFIASKSIYEKTNGNFNPAVLPLVNYWGFGFERLDESKVIDTAEVERLRILVNFDSFQFVDGHLAKYDPNAKLDFSGIAKGYGVDKVAELLSRKRIENYLIEIGGEVVAKGSNKENKPWVLGIRKPIPEEKNVLIETIPLSNRAMATSGNYENYRELESKQIIAHTINPETGFPQSIDEELLSTTVLAPSCMAADGLATAFKVMGLAQSKEVLKQLENVDVFFVYRNDAGEIATYSSLGN